MEDYIVVGSKTTLKMSKFVNPVEQILKTSTQGLSIRKLKQVSGLPKRTIKYHIYTSKFIEDTNPVVHGSSKNKISVFNYNELENNYFKRKQRNKRMEEQISV